MKKEASAPNQAYVKPARGSKSMQANPGTFDAVASRLLYRCDSCCNLADCQLAWLELTNPKP